MSIKSRLLTYCPFPIVIAACFFAVACRGEAHSAPADTRPTTVDEQMPSRLAVSQYLIGQNDWGANLPDSIWPVVGASGVKIVRIGGTGYNRTPLDNATLLHQVDEIRSIGAEPLIQVSNIAGADAAAATVQYINVTNGRHVTFWSIGNEPDGQMRGSTAAQIAAYIQSYITQIAPAMRDVDPAIKIVGPELSYYNATTFGDLLGGAYDISGTDSKHRYYLDGITFHRYGAGSSYTRSRIMNLLHGGLASTIKSLISQINGANALHRRNGSHALTWGITEFNISYAPSDPTVSGIGVCSFFNGQFFAEYYGVGMQLGAQMMNSWSVFENNASCGRYDHGYLGGSVSSPAPRSSYYHTQLLSKYLKGGYLTSSSSNSNVGAIATCSRADLCEGRHEDRGQDGPDSGRPGSRPRKRDSYLAVMVLNEDSTDHSFYVSMDNGTTMGTGDTAIRVSATLANAYSDTISANTTYVLVFDRSGKLLAKVSYSLADDENGTAPTVQRF